MKILMTGATGLIGKEIGKVLAEKGHEIFVVSRDKVKAKQLLPFPCEIIVGDLNKETLQDPRMPDIEAVINLMGEPIVGQRWSAEKKNEIYNSRIVGTRNLVNSLSKKLKTFISASAVGYYGNRGDEILREEYAPGDDFLAKVCVDWEAEAQKAPGRVVCIRTGVVLSRFGGALEQMLFPFRAGVGGELAGGEHWMSWVHIQDIVGLYVFALETAHVNGPVNAVARYPVRNSEFSKALAQSLNKNLGPNIPAVALKTIFGEGADVLVTSQRASAQKAESLGYQYKATDVHATLMELMEPFRNGEDVFYAEQFIPYPPERVFPFFQDPKNLNSLTPEMLNFKIQKVSTAEIQQGTLIDYNLKIHGVPAQWKAKIDEWHPPYKFVDEQLKGPYSLWHHTHEFRPFCGGTLMVDQVRYRLPLGYMGWLVASKLVRKDVESIFSYRREYIAKQDGSLFVT